ncbi:caspase family protein [Yeosuana sp.]|uniref:caspase family protein n=1 Tax=Yeosuana sp. TaxID=2529388 RepID=UPI00404B4728
MDKNQISNTWDGYCPESQLHGKTVRMRLNSSGLYCFDDLNNQNKLEELTKSIVEKTTEKVKYKKHKNMKATFYLTLFILFQFNANFAQNNPEIILPIGHSGSITKMEISQDQKYLLTMSTDNTIKLWDYLSRNLLYTIQNPDIKTVRFSKDGSCFITYGVSDEPITVWDTKKIRPITIINAIAVKYANITNDNTAIIALTYDGLMKWETLTSNKIELPITDKLISDLKFSDDGTKYYYNDFGKKEIIVRNVIANTILSRIPTKNLNPYFILSSKDTFMLIEHNEYHVINLEVFNVKSNKIQSEFKGYFTGKDSEKAIKFSPNEQNVYSTEYFKNKLHVWDVVSGNELPTIVAKKKKETVDGESSTSFNSDAELEDIDENNCIDDYFFSPDSKYLCLKDMVSESNLIDLTNGTRLIYDDYIPDALIFLNSKEILTTGYSSKGLNIMDFPKIKLKENVFKGKSERIDNHYYDPISNTITVVSKDYVQFWNVQTRMNIFQKCEFIAINSDNNKVLVQKRKENLYVIDNKTGKELYEVNLGENQYDKLDHEAIFSPSGKYIIVLSHPNVTIIDAVNGNLVKEIDFGWLKLNRFVQISDDDKYVAVSYKEDTEDVTDIYNILNDDEIIKPVSNLYFSFINKFSDCILSSEHGSVHSFQNIDNNLVIFNFKKNEILFQKTDKFSYVTNYNNRYLIISSYDTSKSYDSYGTKQFPIKTETIDLSSFKKINETLNNNGTSVFFGSSEMLFFTYYYASGNDDDARKIKIWNVVNGKLLGVINLDFSPTNSKIYSDKYDKYLACVTDDNVIYIYSIDTFKLIRKINIGKDIKNVEFAGNYKQLIITVGAFIKLIDFNPELSEEENNNLNQIDFSKVGNDPFVQVNNNYYSLGKSVLKDVSFRYQDNTLSANQLDVRYNRPDKVLEAIGCKDVELINSYKRAYEKRIKKLEINTTSFDDGYSVPEADFDNRGAIEYEQKKEILTLKIKGLDNSHILDRFNVWVNEVPIFGLKGKSIREKNSNTLEIKISVALSVGENRIETSITNIKAIESFHIPLNVNYTPTNPYKEKTYFIGIGIDKFANDKYNLKYSTKDIRDLASKLKEKLGDNLVIDTLFNKNVTVASVKALKKLLQKTNINDKVIISYSGHGVLSKSYDYYLSTYSIDFEAPENNGLAYDELENLLDNIPARKKLMLIDACHSGEVDMEEMENIKNISNSTGSIVASSVEEKTNSNGKAVKGIIPIFIPDSKKIGMKNSFELMQELFVNVGRSTGATIISAAGGTQFALEDGGLKNGAFTYSILEILKNNTETTISKLKEYVNKRVPELTKGMQVPTARTETNAIDWRVW